MGAGASTEARDREQLIRQRCKRLEDDIMFMLGEHADIIGKLIKEPNPTDFEDDVGPVRTGFENDCTRYWHHDHLPPPSSPLKPDPGIRSPATDHSGSLTASAASASLNSNNGGIVFGSAAWQKGEADKRYLLAHRFDVEAGANAGIRDQIEMQQGRDFQDRGVKVEVLGERDQYLKRLAVSASAPGVLVDASKDGMATRRERPAVSHSPMRWRMMGAYAKKREQHSGNRGSHSSSSISIRFGNSNSANAGGGGGVGDQLAHSPFKNAVRQLSRALAMEGEGTQVRETGEMIRREAAGTGLDSMSSSNNDGGGSDDDGGGGSGGRGSAPEGGAGLPWRVEALRKGGSLEHLLHECAGMAAQLTKLMYAAWHAGEHTLASELKDQVAKGQRLAQVVLVVMRATGDFGEGGSNGSSSINSGSGSGSVSPSKQRKQGRKKKKKKSSSSADDADPAVDGGGDDADADGSGGDEEDVHEDAQAAFERRAEQQHAADATRELGVVHAELVEEGERVKKIVGRVEAAEAAAAGAATAVWKVAGRAAEVERELQKAVATRKFDAAAALQEEADRLEAELTVCRRDRSAARRLQRRLAPGGAAAVELLADRRANATARALAQKAWAVLAELERDGGWLPLARGRLLALPAVAEADADHRRRRRLARFPFALVREQAREAEAEELRSMQQAVGEREGEEGGFGAGVDDDEDNAGEEEDEQARAAARAAAAEARAEVCKSLYLVVPEQRQLLHALVALDHEGQAQGEYAGGYSSSSLWVTGTGAGSGAGLTGAGTAAHSTTMHSSSSSASTLRQQHSQPAASAASASSYTSSRECIALRGAAVGSDKVPLEAQLRHLYRRHATHMLVGRGVDAADVSGSAPAASAPEEEGSQRANDAAAAAHDALEMKAMTAEDLEEYTQRGDAGTYGIEAEPFDPGPPDYQKHANPTPNIQVLVAKYGEDVAILQALRQGRTRLRSSSSSSSGSGRGRGSSSSSSSSGGNGDGKDDGGDDGCGDTPLEVLEKAADAKEKMEEEHDLDEDYEGNPHGSRAWLHRKRRREAGHRQTLHKLEARLAARAHELDEALVAWCGKGLSDGEDEGVLLLASCLAASPQVRRVYLDCAGITDKGGAAVGAALVGQAKSAGRAAARADREWKAETMRAQMHGHRKGPDAAEAAASPSQSRTLARAAETTTPLAPALLASPSSGPGASLALGGASGISASISTGVCELSLAGNRLGAGAARRLAAALKADVCPALSWLRLSRNRLCADAAAHLAKALARNTKLHTLLLDGNRLGAAGAGHLAGALLLNDGLRVLDVSANALYCDGAAHVARAARVNRRLATVTMTANGVGQRGKDEVETTERINTGCRIYVD